MYCILIYNFRSLVEETTRTYQDKRNVPVGIGKKFSLSSGALLTNSLHF